MCCIHLNYEGRQKYPRVTDVCMHVCFSDKDVCSVCYVNREKPCCWSGIKVPTASWRLTNHHSSSDTLTSSHSVQKHKHIHGDTNSPSAWLLTFLRCSEVNSLNRLNRPLQSAVVNPQLKNRVFGRISSFSTHGGGAERWAAPVNLFKWSQSQPLKKKKT